jgi:hypothetical protein
MMKRKNRIKLQNTEEGFKEMARTTRSARSSTGGMAPRKRSARSSTGGKAPRRPKSPVLKHGIVVDTSLKGRINKIDDLVWLLQEELRELKEEHWSELNED